MAATALARIRSAVTLLALLALLLAGVAWGWSAMTEPFPESAEVSLCTDTNVPAGTKVYPDQVTVSVANAGAREGLAGRTMQLLVDAGFGRGQTGNAPPGTEVAYAEIWTDDPENPAVRLLKGKLGRESTVVRRDTTLVGVTVIVGDDFMRLREGGAWTKSDEDSRICIPTTIEPEDGITP